MRMLVDRGHRCDLRRARRRLRDVEDRREVERGAPGSRGVAARPVGSHTGGARRAVAHAVVDRPDGSDPVDGRARRRPAAIPAHRPPGAKTTVVNDGLWLNLRDVKRCFEERTYGTDDDIVVEVGGVRWRIGASGVLGFAAEPTCVTDHSSLSALLLGGVRPSALVAGRRMEAPVPRRAATRRCAVHHVAGAVLPDRVLSVR